ncbi:MAG: WS/DGAT/MGAT family O-acyltransferase [Thermoleophilaceae bacterium]
MASERTSHERLTVLDEMFLHLEGPSTHMHVGGIALFEGEPPDYDDVLRMIDERLQYVPRFRQKLATVPLGLGRPVWVDDPHFNLEYHVRHTALPAPGSRAKLNRLTARIMSQQLDRAKPLWEIWFAEGLAGHRFALISKTHHSLVDGVSGTDIMSVLLDPAPEPPVIERETWRPRIGPSSDQLMVEALRERLTSPAEAIRSLQSAASDPAKLPGLVVESARALGEWMGSGFAAPASSLNRPIGPHRRFETVTVPLDDLKRIKNAFGGTVNDVVLSVVSGGLRRLLRGRGELVDELELRAMVPVSVRADHQRGTLGNMVANVWAVLPVYEPDPLERLQVISESMRDLKSSGQAVGAQLLTTLGEFAPPTIVAQASRLVARQRAFNLVVTNVPGPQIPLYTLGREMIEVFPVLPLSGNTTLGVALLSYNGSVGFGLLGDYETTEDLGELAEGIEKSVAELLAAIA